MISYLFLALGTSAEFVARRQSDLGGSGKENDSCPGGIREPAVTAGTAMSAKEKLILQVMEEM
jgi:hypothetical protein